MSESRPKPIPVADDLTRPFWDAARERRLVVQRCEACGYYNHPPRVACDSCLSLKLRFDPVSGRGAVHTFTLMHQRNVPGFEDESPYINIIVELAEQPMLLMASTLPHSERPRVRIGALVEVYFEEREGGVVIPQFRIV